MAERETIHDTNSIPKHSIPSTDSEDQPLARLRERLTPKPKTSVSGSYAENMPLSKLKQMMKQQDNEDIKR